MQQFVLYYSLHKSEEEIVLITCPTEQQPENEQDEEVAIPVPKKRFSSSEEFQRKITEIQKIQNQAAAGPREIASISSSSASDAASCVFSISK